MMGGMDSERPTEPELLSFLDSEQLQTQDGNFLIEWVRKPKDYLMLLPDDGAPYETPDGRADHSGRSINPWE